MTSYPVNNNYDQKQAYGYDPNQAKGMAGPGSATPQNQFGTTSNLNQAEAGQWGDFGNAFSDKVVRIGFIRKVYLIVTAQLIFTFGIVSIFVVVEPVKDFAKSDTGLIFYIASYVVFLTLIIVFSCCPFITALKKVPYNYFFLLGITLSLTYMLGMISAYHQIQAVFIAIGITLFISIGVTLFAMQTKFDFTSKCWLLAVCLSLAMLGFGLACAISFRYIPILQAVYGGIGAILMALFLAIDTQMLIGNKRFKYSPEDYINAALQIYLDICYMFLYILQIFGSKN